VIISWEITSCVIFILGVMSASKSFFDAMHVELGTLFSVVRQIAENLAHANIGGCNRECILVSFAYITSLSRLRKGKVIGAGVSGGC
jgi:hypothetical protein